MDDVTLGKNNLDVIMQDSKFVELAMKVMEMEPDFNEDYLVPFEPDEEDEDNGAPVVKTRKGDYGNTISYVPSKYIRKRLNLAFNQKWSFFIIAEHRETEPFQRWSKQDNDYVDGSNYLKCVGMMVVPGLGIRMEYGVKKVYGDAESSDWKACKTDAFKKCAEAFGIYLNYYDEEDDDSGSNGNGRKGEGSIDLDDLEYTDTDFEDACDTVLTFGKYKDWSLKDIMDEDDMGYLEWLAKEARDDDIKFFASVILKYHSDNESERNNRRNRNNRGGGKNSSNSNSGRSSGRRRSKSSDEEDDDYMNPPEDNKRGKRNNGKRNGGGRKGKSEDDEKEELIEFCRECFENFDRVQIRSMLASISISNKYPKGKTKLENLTLSELKDLAEVLEEGE